ncbi:phosphotransferase [Nonomuraea fuscirosea]|uniref:phosphotransferase n=1 Tax=Nonomuraea fuscirosea TaxID=1291556 RepID=UPI003419CD37
MVRGVVRARLGRMRAEETKAIAAALGVEVVATRTLAGGFSHETTLLELAGGGAVVTRLGGPDPAVEAAVMELGRRYVPVPEVLLVLPSVADGRPAMVLEHVAGTPLDIVLAGPSTMPADPGTLASGPGIELTDPELLVSGPDTVRPDPKILTSQPGDVRSDPEIVLAGAGSGPGADPGSDPRSDPGSGPSVGELRALGVEVGRVVAGIGGAGFDRPGFFGGSDLAVAAGPPWSEQLPAFAESCMSKVPSSRLDPAVRAAWAEMCAAHAPTLTRVDGWARLVHSDMNPKNLLVTRAADGWRVDAVLDWEFSFSGCPYADAANMLRFGADYPAGFTEGFRAGFAAHLPSDLPSDDDWVHLGHVLDMFALSDLVTRPAGNPVADRAAEEIRRWVAGGVPR